MTRLLGLPRILVVGGSGFLGSELCKKCLTEGLEVHSLSRTRPALPIENVIYHYADLADSFLLRSALGNTKYDFVVNCGGKVDHRALSTGGIEVIDTHLRGVLNLLQVLDKSHIRRFIQIGSSDQYGALREPQSEVDREAPFTPYSFAKTAVDHLLQMLWRSEKFPAVSLRLFLIYGPGQNPERLIPQIIRGCLENRRFKVSPGFQKRDFCSIFDIVEAIYRCLNSEVVNGKVFNVATGEGIMIRDIVAKIQKIAGGGEPEFGANPYRKGENMALVANIDQISQVLDWQPTITLDVGLKHTVDYYRKYNFK